MGLYSDKLWEADRLIREYNKQPAGTKLPAGAKSRKPIDSEKFIEKLTLYGGVADELLRQCTWEDLENCGLPRLLSRSVARVFRSNKVEPNPIIKKWMPVFKKWGLHWREHVGLAEKLEKAIAKMGLTESLTEERLWPALRPDYMKPLMQVLEKIRDEHLYKDQDEMFGEIEES